MIKEFVEVFVVFLFLFHFVVIKINELSFARYLCVGLLVAVSTAAIHLYKANYCMLVSLVSCIVDIMKLKTKSYTNMLSTVF